MNIYEAINNLKAQMGLHRRLIIGVFACLIPLIIGGYSLFEPFGRDQGIHATIAYALQEGLVTYKDVYNIKPPMTTVTHLLAIEWFGHSIFSIKYLDMIFIIIGMFSLYFVVIRISHSTLLAISSIIGFSSLYYSLSHWHHAQTDEWAILCVFVALFIISTAWSFQEKAMRWIFMFVAGIIMGVGFTYKYTIGLAGILIFAPAFTKESLYKFYWKDFFWFVGGGVIFLLVVIFFLYINGALGPFLEIQNFIRSYISLSAENAYPSITTITIVLLHSNFNTFIIIFGICIFVNKLIKKENSLLTIIILMLFIIGFVSGYVQGKGFYYHFIPILAGYALIFGLAITEIVTEIKRKIKFPFVEHIAIVVIVGLSGVLTHYKDSNYSNILMANRGVAIDKRFDNYDLFVGFSFPATLKFSQKLREIRNPDDQIFVWGYETILYFLQHTPPQYRYPYAWPFSVNFYDHRYTDDLVGRLNNDPPAYFIVQKKDATPWVTGHELDSKQLLSLHPKIHNYLLNNYDKISESDRFDLWQNRFKTN